MRTYGTYETNAATISAAPPAEERRDNPRLQLRMLVPATVGRGDAMLVDVSRRGARLRHFQVTRRGEHVRVRFQWRTTRFCGTAQVLSEKILSLDAGNGSMVYESRVHFVELSPENAAALDTIVEELNTRQMRRWVENLHGWTAAEQFIDDVLSYGYVRCWRLSSGWETRWTRCATQPPNGFAVNATLRTHAVEQLCEAYDRADASGRALIRATAEASLVR
jgi:hypothetical protein